MYVSITANAKVLCMLICLMLSVSVEAGLTRYSYEEEDAMRKTVRSSKLSRRGLEPSGKGGGKGSKMSKSSSAVPSSMPSVTPSSVPSMVPSMMPSSNPSNLFCQDDLSATETIAAAVERDLCFALNEDVGGVRQGSCRTIYGSYFVTVDATPSRIDVCCPIGLVPDSMDFVNECLPGTNTQSTDGTLGFMGTPADSGTIRVQLPDASYRWCDTSPLP